MRLGFFWAVLFFLKASFLLASVRNANFCQRYAGLVCKTLGKASPACKRAIYQSRGCSVRQGSEGDEKSGRCDLDFCKAAYLEASKLDKATFRKKILDKDPLEK